jgi:hypothetical protein
LAARWRRLSFALNEMHEATMEAALRSVIEPEEEKSLLSNTGAFEQQCNRRARHFATGTHSGLP